MNVQGIETSMFYLMLVAYIFSMVFYWVYLGTRNEMLGYFATIISFVGLAGNTGAIVLRTIIAQRPPLANGYEFILTFCWGIVAVLLFTEFRFKIKALGSFVMPIPFLLIMFILMSMGPEERIAAAIPPALKSQWLTFHVITAMFSYGAFAVSFALGLMYLFKTGQSDEKPSKTTGKNLSKTSGRASRIPALETLDELSYKVVGFAFPLLTLCIITGAIWANYAWGTYWSWDPKETWSLITWIIYAGYLHARLMYGWKGKRAAWLAVFGFLAVLFTFFGVNYFLPGLHSYAS